MTASTLLQEHLDPVNVCSCSGVFMDVNPTSYYWGGNQSRCQGAGVSFLSSWENFVQLCSIMQIPQCKVYAFLLGSSVFFHPCVQCRISRLVHPYD